MGKSLDRNRRMHDAKKCFWYLLNYNCMDGMLELANTEGCELFIPNNTGPLNSILSLNPHESKKTLGVRDLPAGGNTSHLEHIKDKVNA